MTYRASAAPACPPAPWWQRVAVAVRAVDGCEYAWWRQRQGGRWAPVPWLAGVDVTLQAWPRWQCVEACPATWPVLDVSGSLLARYGWRWPDALTHEAMRAHCAAGCVCEVWPNRSTG